VTALLAGGVAEFPPQHQIENSMLSLCLGFHNQIKTGPGWTGTTNDNGCISQPRWASFGGKAKCTPVSRSQGVIEWDVPILVMSRGWLDGQSPYLAVAWPLALCLVPVLGQFKATRCSRSGNDHR
jgi:hypothetical protein